VVVAAGKTHKNQLRGALAALTNVGASLSGLVITMLPVKGPDAYGYGRYGSAYGYGYSYSSDGEEAAFDGETRGRGRRGKVKN
jgi:hypothetical protein